MPNGPVRRHARRGILRQCPRQQCTAEHQSPQLHRDGGISQQIGDVNGSEAAAT